MPPEEIRKARRMLRLSQAGLARAIGLGANGKRKVHRWEQGEVPISGPAALVIEALLSGWRPSQLPESIGGQHDDRWTSHCPGRSSGA